MVKLLFLGIDFSSRWYRMWEAIGLVILAVMALALLVYLVRFVRANG